MTHLDPRRIITIAVRKFMLLFKKHIVKNEILT